ncbi:MAG: hypothetical protein COA99_18730 [Moraxellaceae bacterium]|nr:MAG: hypothetical protein COA99_18730 [Moraxellaceae bacterium]
MFLKKFIYVNWGGIPNQEFEFGPVNLLSGGNGSGKTTAADAIQTIMTAAHDTLFSYNPGQEETTQRGRGGKQTRTLESYVLGCDDGSYARPWVTDGYIAAVFHPTEGESSEPFTAIIANRAFLETVGSQRQAKLDVTQFFIVTNTQLTIDHFVRSYDDGKHVVPITEINALLAKQIGKRQVEKYDTKKSYLARLYGVLRGMDGRVTDREAMSAAKAFSGFMAYKPNKKGIHSFVANEVLEKKDLGEAIRSVSGLMKNVHAMEDDARKLKESIDILAHAQMQGQIYVERWIEWQEQCYVYAKASYLDEQKLYLDEKQKQSNLKNDLAESEREISVNDGRLRDIQQIVDELNAKRLGVPALRDKDHYEQAVVENGKRLQQLQGPVYAQDSQLRANAQASDFVLRQLAQSSLVLDVLGFGQKSVKKLLKTVSGSKEQALPDMSYLFNEDWVDGAQSEKLLDDVIKLQQQHVQLVNVLSGREDREGGVSLRDGVANLRERQNSQKVQLAKQGEKKQSEIDALETQQVSYPPYVSVALQAIRKQCPAADARVLCDYVEVSDADWQSSIEGYIGGARFSIIVEQEYEAQAISLVRSLGGRNNRARVIQGEKAQRDYQKLRQNLPKNSILHVMNFSHKTAEYYLAASYGSVERVEDAQALRSTRRGVTRDGMGSGSYSMYRCDVGDSELVFGQGARERALLAKRNEFDEILQQTQQANDTVNETSLLLDALDRIKYVQIGDLVQTSVESQRALTSAQEKLQQLDLTEFDDLEDELQQAEAKRLELNALQKKTIRQSGALQTKLETVERNIIQVADRKEEALTVADEKEQVLQKISPIWPEYQLQERLAHADQSAVTINREHLVNLLQEYENDLRKLIGHVDVAIREHNTRCQPNDGIMFQRDFDNDITRKMFTRICQLQKELDNIHNRLKNNVLVERHDKLIELKVAFNTAFVTNLCHSIYQAINDGIRVLDELNDELQNHRFGADQETYRFGSEWVPEFKEYWGFFKEIIDQPQLGDGVSLNEIELTSRSVKVCDSMMSMLLDDDEQKAMRELERISDYRNYRNYEIYKKPKDKADIPLSQYGTGSGGQSETPFYIIRSAAVTSAFRFKEGNSHLRMVLVDEAFSRMDESRSKEVINYLTKQLGLQLVFIMPSSKSGPFLELVNNQFVFAKCPSLATEGELKTQVYVDRQQFNQDKVQALWDNHKVSIHQQATLDFMEEFAE